MGGTICRCSRSQDQVSRAILWLPWYFVNRILDSTRIAEELLGSPATIVQILVVMSDKYGKTLNNIYELAAVLVSLYREDIIYSDVNFYHFTCTRQEGYYTYSEIFRLKFNSGYACDSIGRVMPTEARRINLEEHRAIMLSTDDQKYQEQKWRWDGEFRFLDGTPLTNKKIAFTCYVRSGSSFLRRYIEQITGITTGSTVSLHSSTALQIAGMKGEFCTDDSVWVVKSHHPFHFKHGAELVANKTFWIVRNPLDQIVSFASLCNTASHSNKPEYEFERDYPEYWDWFVRSQIGKMQRFFATLIRHCTQEGRNPLYIVRYEDLVLEPKKTLMGLMSYLFEKRDINGTIIERRIDEVLSKGKSAT